jgi:hypothetical protein
MVHQNSLNQEESKDFHQEHHEPQDNKNPKIEPFTHGFGRGIKMQRTTRGSCIHPPTKSQRERPQNRHKKFAKKRLRKSPKRRNRKDTSKS